MCLYNIIKKSSFEIKIKVKKNNLGIIPKFSTNNHIKNFKKIFFILKKYYDFKNISIISYSYKPGLAGSINVSKVYCKALSFIINKKIIKVNHLYSHIFSNFIGKKIFFPFISFLISGANTIFYLVKGIMNIKIIGKTIDNSVGEIINKIGRFILKIYPTHKYIENHFKNKNILKSILKLPNLKNSNISLSGVFTKYKNFYLRKIFKKKKIIITFFFLIIIIIIDKIFYFKKKYKINVFLFCGGVSKNKKIREIYLKKIKIYFCKKKFCEDNATMVSFLTFLINGFLYKNKKKINKKKINKIQNKTCKNKRYKKRNYK
ncbi:hypothetical protein [Candidatus Vidania fulgoroideorum]